MIGLQRARRDSLLTHLDFRSKLLMIAVISLVAFVWESPVALAAFALATVIASLMTGIEAAYIGRIVRLMMPFYALLLITHGFWNTQQVKILTGRETLTPLFTFPSHWPLVGGGGMSVEGLAYGWAVIFKTIVLMLTLPLVIFTTDVNQMMVGLVRIGVPYRLVFILSSTLRFFPLLFGEAQAIIEAQRLRGLEPGQMGPLQRARVYARIAIPLILGAMVKSQQLEIVLQARAFTGSGERTYLHESRLKMIDWAVILLCLALFIAAMVAYFRAGVGRFAWLIFPPSPTPVSHR
jgi:energy-coupling factor transport system permease protein